MAAASIGSAAREDEESAGSDQREADEMMPADRLLQVQHRKAGEDQERDDLLHGLQLRRRIGLRADAVRRHRKPVLEKAMPQLTRTAPQSGVALNLRCPYQAKVMNTFDATSRGIGAI